MNLWAISDLHLAYRENRDALEALPTYGEDWLIVAGDIGETLRHAAWAWRRLTDRFAKVIWTPGNHDLWTLGDDDLRGENKYRALCMLANEFGVVGPDDTWPIWEGEGGPALIAPIFTLFDYSFGPTGSTPEQAVAWAAEEGISSGDESRLHADPHADRPTFCRERCRITEDRLERERGELPLILVDHYPLRRELIHIPRVPRFVVWCGTSLTEDWPRRFSASVVISGHLHVRSTEYRDGILYEEVSLGYPPQWKSEKGLAGYLRQILPRPPHLPAQGERIYHR